jgi:DegV family protein with EDD domain
MENDFKAATLAGYERVAAWADLLDDINVYPVADADTGRNLKISLAPIKEISNNYGQITGRLLRAATGNSGNIAAAFFSEFLSAESAAQLPQKIASGNSKAWDSISEPKQGTMLTVFETLSQVFNGSPDITPAPAPSELVSTLVDAVHATHRLLPELKEAGVVDSGALGMFLFFEGFFKTLYEKKPAFISITETFGNRLHRQRVPRDSSQDELCINTFIKADRNPSGISRKLEEVGSSIVTVQEGDNLKIHLHSKDLDAVRQELQTWGNLVEWEAQPIITGPPAGSASQSSLQKVRIVADAAGSITRQDADRLGITLMDSYIITGDNACPETGLAPGKLYKSMRTGQRVSTAQASIFERHQSYESICSRFDRVVYLCVGSAYTGIYQAACNWQANQTGNTGMTVLDSSAASGRLGLITLAVADFANKGKSLAEVVAFAGTTIEKCEELVFLDQLKYLVAGGRISKTGGFFGDLFSVKPVISPLAGGVRKIGVVRKNTQQLPFALAHFAKRIGAGERARILLQYTDNRDRVAEEVKPAIQSAFPRVDIILNPLSLTSGVHMGPGTWGIAVLPEFKV